MHSDDHLVFSMTSPAFYFYLQRYASQFLKILSILSKSLFVIFLLEEVCFSYRYYMLQLVAIYSWIYCVWTEEQMEILFLLFTFNPVILKQGFFSSYLYIFFSLLVPALSLSKLNTESGSKMETLLTPSYCELLLSITDTFIFDQKTEV